MRDLKPHLQKGKSIDTVLTRNNQREKNSKIGA